MRHFLIFILLLISPALRADTPLTGIFLAQAYADLPRISAIIGMREVMSVYRFDLTEEDLTWIDRRDVELDQKVALVNALGFGENGNLRRFVSHLAAKYSMEPAVIDSSLVFTEKTGSELPEVMTEMFYHDLVLLSYMKAMHDYLQPIHATRPVYEAVVRNQHSEAAWWVLGMIASQIMLDVDWCMVHSECETIAEMKAMYTQDIMREDAVAAIMDFVGLYAVYCEESGEELDYTDEFTEEYPEEFRGDEHMYEDFSDEALPFTEAYFDIFPVYEQPDVAQQGVTGQTVNLKLLTTSEGPYFMRWIFPEESRVGGTRFDIRVGNTGNTTSIETNLAIFSSGEISESGLPFHTQARIPALQPGEETVIAVILPELWIADYLQAFQVFIDYDDNIREVSEADNTRIFSDLR